MYGLFIATLYTNAKYRKQPLCSDKTVVHAWTVENEQDLQELIWSDTQDRSLSDIQNRLTNQSAKDYLQYATFDVIKRRYNKMYCKIYQYKKEKNN